MEVLVLIVFCFVAILAMVLAKFVSSRPSGAQPFYDSREFLLTRAEAAFFAVLVDAIGSSGHVFAKVRVADVIKTRKGIDSSERARAFNAISQKHLDFVVCRLDDFGFVLAIELDDSSHGTVRAQKRDALVDQGCCSAGIPLLRVKAARTYSVKNIRQLITSTLVESGDVQTVDPTASAGVN